MALRHVQRTVRKLADDGQPLGIAEGKKHVGKAEFVPAGMGQVCAVRVNGSILVEPSGKIQ